MRSRLGVAQLARQHPTTCRSHVALDVTGEYLV